MRLLLDSDGGITRATRNRVGRVPDLPRLQPGPQRPPGALPLLCGACTLPASLLSGARRLSGSRGLQTEAMLVVSLEVDYDREGVFKAQQKGRCEQDVECGAN